jgi:signal transduction histidine kinase
MLARGPLHRRSVRPSRVAAITAVYLALVAAAIALILHHPAGDEADSNLAPMLRTVQSQYVGTLSALAVHTTLFNDQSERHAAEAYLRLLATTMAFDETLKSTDLPEPLTVRLKEIVREITLAQPVIDQIGSSLIEASQGFSALYGLEPELGDMTTQLDALSSERHRAAVAAQRTFALEVMGLLIGAILFSGMIVGLFWRDYLTLQARYAKLADDSQALQAAKRRAEATSEAKSRFLATMSHEVRTPLNGVIGLAQLLTREQLNPRAQQFAGKIYECATALLQIINEVLDISSIEAGTVRVAARVFSLDELLTAACAPFEGLAQQKGLELEATVESNVNYERFVGDDLRLRQVLHNLIGNAVKFTQAGSIKIVVSCGGPGSLRFRVTDTGIGIPEDQLSLIFERFHQVDNAETRRQIGTGLGLAISRELTGMMGGTLTVESEPGDGSTFEVKVPLSPVTEAEEADKAPISRSA